MTTKIILDTDPGIDDAMAILFAEASPAIELVGLTTIYGNADIDTSTRNALYLKQRFGFQCDVAKGATQPLKREPVGASVAVHGENGFGDVPIEPPTISADSRPAHQYIIEMLKASPGEITLVAVGPLTNLALALEQAPEITKLVKEVVIMGGAFGTHEHTGNVTPFAEANVHDDPHAADIVFTADWPVTVVGLDVTHEAFFSTDYIDTLRDTCGEVGEFMWDISRFYLDFYKTRMGVDGCFVHDPSAIAYVIDPDLFEVRKGPIRVVCEGPAEGLTLQKYKDTGHKTDEWANYPPQNVAVSVNDQALLDLYLDAITSYSD
ncbi:Pyrimidine-specific ribonucleoside hydrolase RihB [Grimontia celer]|uniref:Pyrimidine-specific ribonucleoside hydrolase RihB n=1 Tax=Grimontia celer TaxID=1796497 RepID=A0A128FA99_9GAMM|nr:nucleoside hydrolase [Grimontia celer]CZF83274.1 Pyrimidine-specific ribonucleoside hydrolase RihB [Grimontia celer]